jgi:hypothetical protein
MEPDEKSVPVELRYFVSCHGLRLGLPPGRSEAALEKYWRE